MASGGGGSANAQSKPPARRDAAPKNGPQSQRRDATVSRKRRQIDRPQTPRGGHVHTQAPGRGNIGPVDGRMAAKLRVVKQMGFPSIGAYVAKHNGDLRKQNKDLTCPWKSCTPVQDCNDVRCRACNKSPM